MVKIRIEKSTLIIVDVQNDFYQGIPLAVPNGNKIILILNKYIEKFKKLIQKIKAYSGFKDTELEKSLKKGVNRVFVGRLATDYCVKYTILDASKEDLRCFFLEDASRGMKKKLLKKC